jgi:cytochrome P450
LSGLSFYLARYPECFAELQQELQSTFADVEEIVTGPKLLGCKYMRACVEEGLRMCPGVPGYLTRESRTDATIDGHFIPAGTQIGAPGWTTHRNPDIYPHPQVFKPERWLTESPEELQRLRSNHFPFSYGPRGCIGKNLAYNTIYLVIARLAFLYDISSSETLPLEFHVKDHFAAGEKDGPFLKFTPSLKA